MARPRKTNSETGKSLGKLIYYFFMFFIWIVILPIMIVVKLYKSGKISKKVAIISGVVVGLLWFIIVIAVGGSSSTDTTSTTSTGTNIERSIQEPTATETPAVEVSAVSLTAEKTELVLGDSVKLQASVIPEDAKNKSVTYVSSDEAVLTVTDKGDINAVGPGSATITATANNGVSSSVSFNVDGSKRVVRLITRSSRTNDVNIGNEWSYSYEINGERVLSGDYILTVGDYLAMKATITESDDSPDVGSNSTTHTVTQEDLINGFSESFEVYVTENGGRNSGKSAVFTVSFSFNLK